MTIPRVLTAWYFVLFLPCVGAVQGEKSDVASLTAKQEATATAFAKRHHRELFNLLKQLKEMDAERYESAISELHKTNERIERFKARMPDRYKSEIELWKIDSRVRLLIARSVNGMEEETREQVKTLLLKRNRIRAAQIKSEIARLNERAEKLTEQMEQLTKENESLAQRDLERLMRSAQSRSNSQNTNQANARKKSSRTSTPSKKK